MIKWLMFMVSIAYTIKAQNLLCNFNETEWKITSTPTTMKFNATLCTVDITNTNSDNTVLILPHSNMYTNYDITLVFSMILTTPTSFGSLLFRLSDASQAALTGFEIRLLNNSIDFIYHVSGIPTPVSSKSPNEFSNGQDYTFRIIAFERNMWLYLNGGIIPFPALPNPYNSSLKTPSISGAIGFTAFSAASFTFSRLEVNIDIGNDLLCAADDWHYTRPPVPILIGCGIELQGNCTKAPYNTNFEALYEITDSNLYQNYLTSLDITITSIKNNPCCISQPTNCEFGITFRKSSAKNTSYAYLLNYHDNTVKLTKDYDGQSVEMYTDTYDFGNFTPPLSLSMSVIAIDDKLSLFIGQELKKTKIDCEVPIFYAGTVGIYSGIGTGLTFTQMTLDRTITDNNYLCDIPKWSPVNTKTFSFEPCQLVKALHGSDNKVLAWIGDRSLQSLSWTDVYVRLIIDQVISYGPIEQIGFIFRATDNDTFYLATINNYNGASTFYLSKSTKTQQGNQTSVMTQINTTTIVYSTSIQFSRTT
eukprot:332860_1